MSINIPTTAFLILSMYAITRSMDYFSVVVIDFQDFREYCGNIWRDKVISSVV